MSERQWVLAKNRRNRQHNMGKKHIIETNQEELIKEGEKVDEAVKRADKVKKIGRASCRERV